MQKVKICPKLLSNKILASLSYEDCTRICPGLQKVLVKKGDIPCHPYKRPNFIYFPIDSLFSLSWNLNGDHNFFASLIGNEGIVGASSLLEDSPMPYMATCQYSGYAMRIDLEILRKEFWRSELLKRNLWKYNHQLLNQIGVNIACSRSHPLKDQLTHFLLQTLDRIPGSEIMYTQEEIAHMLGVRRERIGQAAILLQEEGKIAYSRGHISILDEEKMKRESCPCYHFSRSELEGPPPPLMADRPRCLNSRAAAT